MRWIYNKTKWNDEIILPISSLENTQQAVLMGVLINTLKWERN